MPALRRNHRGRHAETMIVKPTYGPTTITADTGVGTRVNAGLKLPENQRFEIVGFFALLGRILWFDPRREYSSIPTANSRSRRAQGLSRLAASSRPPAGLGLDW